MFAEFVSSDRTWDLDEVDCDCSPENTPSFSRPELLRSSPAPVLAAVAVAVVAAVVVVAVVAAVIVAVVAAAVVVAAPRTHGASDARRAASSSQSPPMNGSAPT